jgi:molybdate transport system ATP-binding protein
MVYVSHSISEVVAIAPKALVLSRGRQLAFDETRRVVLTPFVHSVVEGGSLENLLDVKLTQHGPDNNLSGARVGDTVLWLSGVPRHVVPGDTVSISIRAGDIIVAVERPERISARNILRGRIQGIHRVEDEVLLYVDVGVSLMVQITPQALSALELLEGQDVYLVIKSSSILVLE